MSVTYTEPGTTKNISTSPETVVTVEVDIHGDGAFENAVHSLVMRLYADDLPRPLGQLLMTTEHCWSGLSEFTITNTWTEVILTAPTVDWEMRWETMPAFFKALAEAVDDA